MNDRLSGRQGLGYLMSIAIALFFPIIAQSVTIDEAIQSALGNSFNLKEQGEIVKRFNFSYISTIDPYLPQSTVQSSYIRSTSPSASGSGAGTSTVIINTSPLIIIESSPRVIRDVFTFAGTVSYRLFDGGERYARRKGTFFSLEREREVLKSVRQDVLFNVKSAFYMAQGTKYVVERRKEALETAEKIYNLTRGRYDEGVAKKSEYLQSEVRLTNARIDLQRARKELEKALEELWSLMIVGEGAKKDVEGPFEEPRFSGDYEKLIERAMMTRPEIIAGEKEVERFRMVYKERRSAWFPKIDAQLQQTRQDGRFFPEGRSDTLMINFSYPIFDGVGRYYNMQGALSDINAARQRLQEIRRTTRLAIVKAFKDYELSTNDVRMYTELVQQAVINYNQLYGEYRVGKGDILSLLQSEKDLASAKENQATSIARANIAFAFLEKVAYMNVQ